MNDDEYGAVLLRPLATEPSTATHIDVGAAMRRGRRARRTRSWAAISGLTALTAATATGGALALTAPAALPEPDLPADPALPTACSVVRLPDGGAALSAVTGADPSGRYLVGTTNPDADDRSVLVWRDGALIADVPQPDIRPAPAMADINASGVAAGSTPAQPHYPYSYHNGKVSRLDGTGRVVGINNAGVIAGTRYTGGPGVPVRWAGPAAKAEPMKLPPGTSGGKAVDIAEDGTIVVTLFTKTFIEQSYLWFPDGTSRPIDGPEASKGQTNRFWATHFRFGWLYGTVSAFLPQGASPSGPGGGPLPKGVYSWDSYAYRYHVATGTWQELPDGLADELSGSYMGREAFIGRQVFEFPGLPDQTEDDGYDLASVSADGRTAGGQTLSNRADPAYRNSALMWRCS